MTDNVFAGRVGRVRAGISPARRYGQRGNMALIDDARFTARMCGKIMSYWYEQGHPEVEAKPILVPLKAGGQTWGIKSNLVNGLPPSKVSVPMARAA